MADGNVMLQSFAGRGDAVERLGADLADVALVFLADRLGVHNILTVDRKDFDRYRTPLGKKLKRLWVKD